MLLPGSLTFDEYGRPFVIIKDEEKKARLQGVEAIKSHILAAKCVASKLKTSLGPKGLDKILISQDGDLTVTNDGATILELMDAGHEVAKLMCQFSRALDQETGDGTTGVIVFAGALLEKAEELLDRGVHPIRIADGFDLAAKCALQRLDEISTPFVIDKGNIEPLVNAAVTALGSKIVNKCGRRLAEIAVDAVVAVSGIETRVVSLDSIKLECLEGGRLEDTTLINGVLLQKRFTHVQMSKQLRNPKVALLMFPLDAQAPKTKHHIDIKTMDDYKSIGDYDKTKFKEIIDTIKEVGVDFIVCPYKIKEEINYILVQENIIAIDSVSNEDIEKISMATRSKLVPKIDELTADKLGTAQCVREMNIGTNSNNSMIVIEGGKEASNVVTIFVRGSNRMIVDEAKRSLHDALCVVRSLIIDNRMVYGGGSAELACSIAATQKSDTIATLEQYAFRAFGEALESIPNALAENSGYSPVYVITSVKSRQISENNPALGIDCMLTGNNDMREQNVIEPLMSKKQQIITATQLVNMVLKIDDILSYKDVA